MNSQQLDDSEIARLVHDVADGWTMPPVRLDAPAWRERVRGSRARRIDAARGWLARAGRAATAAVALTVVAAFVAIMVTRPPADPGNSPDATDRSTPGASGAVRPTALPKLLTYGDLPLPSRFVVRAEPDFAFVDLANGSIRGQLTGGRSGSELQARADGTFICLCVSESGSAAGKPTTVSVRLDRLDPEGTTTSSHDLRSFEGQPDARDGSTILPDRPPNALTATSFSEGGRYGFVGWSRRTEAAWESGLLVVELTEARVVSELPLPDVTTGAGDARRVPNAPRVVGSSDDDLVIARSWYEFAPADAPEPGYTAGVEAFRASNPGGVLANLAAVPGVEDCGDTVRFGGLLPDGGTWLACTGGLTPATRLRRVAADGTVLPEVVVPGVAGIEGDSTALSRDGTVLYAWNAASATLTRIDTATGETRAGEGRVARAEPGPLAALGRWLAPAASAKSFLQSSVVLSRDGRVYALGVQDGVASPEVTGSAGVFVFDADSLELIDTYEPTADFISLAIGVDNRFLYAAGLPGVDALGRQMGSQGASITVFDTSDGSTRVVAGQLGGARITFGPEPLG